MTRPLAASSRLATIILLCALMAGCGTTAPPRYYTLAAVPPSVGAPATAVVPARIVVGPVNLPDYLDRRPIVTRDSAYAVHLATNDYWAAPLQDMVPRILVADLAARLPADRIDSFPELSSDYRITVDIDRFDTDASGLATLTARWRIYGKTAPQPLQTGEVTLQQQGDAADYQAGTAALSAALGDLADHLVQALMQARAQAPRAISGS